MHRRKVLIFQHVPFEPLGTLDPILREAGFRVRYVNFDRNPEAVPDLDRYSGLIVLGGPMNADDVERYPNLATEVQLIRDAVDRDMNVLGICLGAQLLAKALGASVSPDRFREIGWYDVTLTEAGAEDELLSCFDRVQRVFQWHSDGFGLPEEAVLLAGSEICPHQAFRYGDKAYGFQFHLEGDEPLIERWLTTPAHAEELAAHHNEVSPDAIRAETKERIEMLGELSRQTFGRWIDRFERRVRRRPLSSR